MTVPSHAGASLGGTALLERAIGYTLGSLSLVTPEGLAAPTPCPAWRLGGLLAHLEDSLAALCEAAQAGRVAPPAADDAAADPTRAAETAVVAAVREQARRLLGVWSRGDAPEEVAIAGCPLSTSIAAGAGAVEVAIHGWDVARACGHDRPLPPRLAEDLLHLAPLLITDADRPARFAAPVRPPPEAGPSDRLIAFSGRRA